MRVGIVSAVGVVLVLAAMPSRKVAAQADAAGGASRISYTDEQANRGQMLFRRHCQFCHSTNRANRKAANEPQRGFNIGASVRAVSNLGGRYIFTPYPSVYHLYARIRDAMPAWDIDAVSPAQKVDIVAFLLRENGLPAGTSELALDPAVMKTMRLARAEAPPEEAGFEPIFNGRDFTNLKFFFGFNCTLPPGCARTAPTVFSVSNGMIVAAGRYHGYMYTEKRYLNFDLRLEYRIEPPPDHDLSDGTFVNGGGLALFVTEHRIWPAGIEVEGDNERMLHPYGLAVPIEASWDKEAASRANKGPGPWNAVRIVAKNGRVDLFLNATKVGEVTKHPFNEPGHIAIQYQGGTWMFRHLRIKTD